MKRRVLFLLLILTTLPATIFGEERFPPPEFTTGYQLPTTKVPGPHADWFGYLDIAVLLVALSLASYLALKKRSRHGVFALMLASLAYFGFYRHGCVCPVGAIQNVAMAVCQHTYALPLIIGLFFLLPLVFALFFGRVFCAAVCPLGAAQDVMLLKPLRVPAWLAAPLALLPHLYLGVTVLFAATGSYFLICRFDPFVAFFRFDGSPGMLIFGGAMLLLATVVGRPYCRFLCPYGALLRLVSPLAKWRVAITPDKCIQCRLCEGACPFGAIKPPTEPTIGANPAPARRQLAFLLLLLPVLVFAGGWMGARSSGSMVRLNADVRLADQLWLENQGKSPTQVRFALAPLFGISQDAADLKYASDTFRNSGNSLDDLFRNATKIRKQFRLGGWLLGGWIGLVIGLSLIRFSLKRRRTDYEPDPASCFSCGRCYRACPREHIRLSRSLVSANREAGGEGERV